GEVAKARLPVGAVIPDRLVQTDQALLDQVVGVPAGEEVRRCLEPHEAVVPPHDPVVCVRMPLLGERDQIPILNLRLSVRRGRQSSHETSLLIPAPSAPEVGIRGALPPMAPHLYHGTPRRPSPPPSLKLELIVIS